MSQRFQARLQLRRKVRARKIEITIFDCVRRSRCTPQTRKTYSRIDHKTRWLFISQFCTKKYEIDERIQFIYTNREKSHEKSTALFRNTCNLVFSRKCIERHNERARHNKAKTTSEQGATKQKRIRLQNKNQTLMHCVNRSKKCQ